MTEVNQLTTYNIQQHLVIPVHIQEVQSRPTDGSEVALLGWAIGSEKFIFVFLIDSELTVRL